MKRLVVGILGRCHIEFDHCRTELDRLRLLDGTRLPVLGAVGASAVLAAAGNCVVLAGRRWGHEEWLTLATVPVIGLAGAALLRLGGWSWQELGIRGLRIDPPAGLPRWLFRAALILGVGFGATGVLLGKDVPALNVVRLVVGTALGEELVHRSVVLGAWVSTGVLGRWIVLANMVTFALWHVAGAFHETGVAWWEIVGPGLLAPILLWARLRTRSLATPAAFHGGVNMGEFLL